MLPLSSIASTKSIIHQFESIDAYLQAVHEILREGHMPDIADLNDRISNLCSSVQKAPLEIQEVFQTKLDELLHKLNTCENEMTTLHKTSVNSAQR